jgi:chemotaxis family two-component system response regulator Rcp1
MKILLVEDNMGDIRLIEEALQEAPIRSQVSIVRDGTEALAYLRREGAYANAARPDLILLDLFLPGEDGRGVLAAVRADPSLKHIPVVMLTNSREEPDKIEAYDLGANLFFRKPTELHEYSALVQALVRFWNTRLSAASRSRL